MQKIATRVFIYASLVFGISGIVLVFTNTDPGDDTGLAGQIVAKLFMASIFVILTSFALSVAGKYLNGKS